MVGTLIRRHSSLLFSTFQPFPGSGVEPGVGGKGGFLPDQRRIRPVRGFSVVIESEDHHVGIQACVCVCVSRQGLGV